MHLERVITLANRNVQLEFNAMERSLRSTGCDLPLEVLPFDDKYDLTLPTNASWLTHERLFSFVKSRGGVGHHRKYLLLLLKNYHLLDVDAVFVENPAPRLEPHQGFIATCIQWTDPLHAIHPSTASFFKSRWTQWQLKLFNGGQYASSVAVYEEDELIEALSDEEKKELYWNTDSPWEQPAVNYLVHRKDTTFVSLNLPPHNMQSTWALDYKREYTLYWEDAATRPYIIHYAGNAWDNELPINALFFDHLTRQEQAEWREKQKLRLAMARQQYVQRLTLPGKALFWMKYAGKSIGVLPDRSAKRRLQA